MKLLIIITLALLAASNSAHAQYTFATEVQSTNTANMTFNSTTGTFQYVAAADSIADFAGLHLIGNEGAFITTTNDWSASITVDLSSRSMAANGVEAYAAMGLYIIVNGNDYDSAKISLNQENNTGSGINNDFYGTLAFFEAITNNTNLVTTPLGGSSSFDGSSYQKLSGGVDASAAAESIEAASGLLTLSNDASTGMLTGYYNGSPVGSISMGSWGPNPSLFVAVVGFSAGGVAVASGTATAKDFFADQSLLVTTVSLTTATNNEEYSQTLAASGGEAPFHWTNSSGALPPGLALATNGVISGKPTSAGTFTFTVKVTDVLGGTTTRQLAITVLTLQVSTFGLPVGTNQVAYSAQLSAIDGQPPFNWTLVSGVLPSGLALATNGVISGTPTTNGVFNFTVKAADAFSSTATQLLTLTVGSPPGVTLQPTNTSIVVAPGSDVTLAVSVTGTGPFSYQWQFNGTNLPNSTITTVAGNGNYGSSGDGGLAIYAEFSEPIGTAVDEVGDFFVVDYYGETVSKVGTNGIIETVAGGGNFSSNGIPAIDTFLFYPSAVTLDSIGNMFIAINNSEDIREVKTNGLIYTVAGTGTPAYSGDGGPATNAELWAPSGLAVDAIGNLFVSDAINQRIRKVGTNGIINTVAGTGAKGGLVGNGGPATNADLNTPTGVAVDSFGNLFIADSGNNMIRKVGTNGVIQTVAGNGTAGYAGDGGAAYFAELNGPHDVAVDAAGDLFVADENNDCVRKIDLQGIITTVAGNGKPGYSGDGGVATGAELNLPTSVAVDTSGNIFIADEYNLVIRKVAFSGPMLSVNNIGATNLGQYDVVVSSSYGSVTSSVINLSLSFPGAPLTLSEPQVTAGKTSFTFQISGPPGGNFVLQSSTNLMIWTSLSTSTIPALGTVTFTNSITGDRGFYRALLQ